MLKKDILDKTLYVSRIAKEEKTSIDIDITKRIPIN